MKPAATDEEWARRNSADEHAQDLTIAVEWLLQRHGEGRKHKALTFALGVLRQFQVFFVSDYDEADEPLFWGLWAEALCRLEGAEIGADDLRKARNAAIIAASCPAYAADREASASAPAQRTARHISEAGNVIRLPTSNGRALETAQQKKASDLACRMAMWRDAERVDVAVRYIFANWGKPNKPSAAFQRIIDACHKVQKVCSVEAGDAIRKAEAFEDYMAARVALSLTGVGDQEIDAAFQRVIAIREARCPAETTVSQQIYLARMFAGAGCLLIVASGRPWRLPPAVRQRPPRRKPTPSRSR